MSVDKILEQREQTHGEFSKHAAISQNLKMAMRVSGDQWKCLSTAQKEALEMIVHKIARILNGNANYKDHWDDIAGYATLVSRELGKKDTE